MILNTPNNPTGRVFSRDQVKVLVEFCEEFDALLITDEIYEHIVFDGEKHVPPISLSPGARERCVVVNSLSKTFSVTGWRVGWVIAPPELTASIRKVHDFLTVGAPTPLQQAGVEALGMPDRYFAELAAGYQVKRDRMLTILGNAGFRCHVPKGAYYIMCAIDAFDFRDDVALCRHLIEEIGVAAVPGSSFFSDPAAGRNLVRFCFAKKEETFELARERLARLRG